jgi:hypothetical protein
MWLMGGRHHLGALDGVRKADEKDIRSRCRNAARAGELALPARGCAYDTPREDDEAA